MLGTDVARHAGTDVGPRFESLEPRLLLTTLQGGEFFVYLNSEDVAIRVGLDYADPSVAIELMTEYNGEIVNLPGAYFGDPGMPVIWDDGQDIFVIDPTSGLSTGWLGASATTRGAQTEIWGIYVEGCTVDTVLTIVRLANNNLWDANFDPGDIDPWTGTTPIVDIGATAVTRAPNGSGPVIVGAAEAPMGPSFDIRYLPASPNTARPVNPMGVFPGGDLSPGITIYSGAATPVRGIMLGSNVQAVAVSLAGGADVYAVDDMALTGQVVSDGLPTGLGQDVSAITADSGGQLYVVDNSQVVAYQPGILGTTVTTLAADAAGTFYAVDEPSHTLMSWAGAAAIAVGTSLTDSAEPTFRYDNVRALAYNPSDGGLYGVANITDTDLFKAPAAPVPNGPFLFLIDTVAGTGSGRVLLTNVNDIAALAFNSTGTCYAVDPTSNTLVTIDPATGVATAVGVISAGGPVSGVVGLECIGDTLYAATATTLYQVDPATAVAAAVLPLTVNNVDDLAYDVTNPGMIATVGNQGGPVVARVVLASMLASGDATGATSRVGPLVDATDDTILYRNVTAMDTDNSNAVYAVAEAIDLDPANWGDTNKYMVTIDRTTGQVTRVSTLSPTVALTSIAFDTAGAAMYACDNTGKIYQVTWGTGQVTQLSDLGGIALEGIDFVNLTGTESMYGVTAGELYQIDYAGGTAVLLGGVGRGDLSSLTADPNTAGVFWSASVDGGAYRAVKISLSGVLVDADVLALPPGVASVGLLFDSVEAGWGYKDIHALDFDASDVLYGIATVVNVDPLNTADPGVFGPYLVTIDPSTGTVTQQTTIDVADLSTLAFDSLDTLFGVNPATGELVTLDRVTGVTTVVGPLTDLGSGNPMPAVTGIDFVTHPGTGVETLFAVTDDALYWLDPLTGDGTLIDSTLPLAGLSGLANDPTDSAILWASYDTGAGYGLVRLPASTLGTAVVQDMGRIRVAGTMAGAVNTEGSIELIDMGFLWGNINIAGNLQALIMRHGGGAIPVPPPPNLLTPTDSVVTVGGSLIFADVRSDTLYSAIQVENDPSVELPGYNDVLGEYLIAELEVVLPAGTDPDPDWLMGVLVDYSNDTMATAQIVSHPSGTFTLSGVVTLDDPGDWYALPLLADQTLTLQGIGTAILYDAAGRWLDSFGYETIEDYGLPFRPGASKPMTFTAPAAGAYYLGITTLGMYQLEVTSPAASLGGVNVVGNHTHVFGGTGPAVDASIAVKQAGNLGAVIISGTATGTAAQALGGGTLISFEAGEMLGTVVTSEGGIGLVGSRVGSIGSVLGPVVIAAGASSGIYDYDAHLQNVRSAADIFGNISASGSIGVVEAVGTIYDVVFRANSDTAGPAARVDLIHVGGDWGSAALGVVPELYHGPGGDFGYIHVAGTIYVRSGAWIGPLTETTYDDGRTVILNDDGGGRLTVTPQAIIDPATGQPTGSPTLSYAVIGVDDVVGGVGGVIMNLRINGSALLSASGVVQVCYLDLSGAVPGTNVAFSGAGQAHIYHVYADQPIDSLVNRTGGPVVSGNLNAVGRIEVWGSIGPRTGSTGAWIPGSDLAPVSGNVLIEPQYGWFHGTVNGLQVSGDLGELKVYGSLGDLRVIGQIGKVTVDADGVTAPGGWDGICGLIWSQTRIGEIDVGDGLADDGGGQLCQAAIMSTGSIAKVYIRGPRVVSDGKVFGELNGSILAMADEALPGTDRWGRPITVNVDAIDEVIGVNGASCTAVIGAGEMDWFFVGKAGLHMWTGTIGTVSFSGAGAQIYGAEIAARQVRSVRTGAETNGVSYSYVSGSLPAVNELAIGEILAGGPGLYHCWITANGADIGTIMGVGAAADLIYNSIVGSDGIRYIRARDLITNGIHAPGTVGSIVATRDMTDNQGGSDGGFVGAINAISVAGDFARNSLIVAGEIGVVTIGGAFVNSFLSLQGPTVAYLRSLTVNGDISGAILSGGRIGRIVTQTGSISADVSTLPGGWNNDVDLIQTAGGFTGKLEVAGSLRKFISRASLGDNPELTVGNRTQVFNIWGNLDYLLVGGIRGVTSHLYADINVGGNIGTLDVDGTFYGRVAANGDLNLLTIDGGFGGVLGAGVGPRGSLTVLGEIRSMRFAAGNNLVADLTVGGSIRSINMTDMTMTPGQGDIVGNITSLYGAIQSVTVTGGSILGNLTAAQGIGRIFVRGLNGDPGNIVGDILVQNGGIRSLSVYNGNLDANVTVLGGNIDSLIITNGSATAGRTIHASAAIGTLMVRTGNLDADVEAGTDLRMLSVYGGSLTGNVTVGGSARVFNILGDVVGSTVRIAGGSFSLVFGGDLNGVVLASLYDLGVVTVRGSVINSQILAGYDPVAVRSHSANIRSMTVMGDWTASTLAVGVDPVDGDFSTLGDNLPAAGVSTLGVMTVRGTADPVGSLVLVDTAYSRVPNGLLGVTQVVDGPPVPLDPSPPAIHFTSGLTTAPDGLAINYRGSGMGSYDPATGQIILQGTGGRASLILNFSGAPKTVHVAAGDDDGLASLMFRGNLLAGDVSLDGAVTTFMAGDVQPGATWQLLGGATSIISNGLTGVKVTAGRLGTWRITGDYARTTDEGLVADEIRMLTISGNLTASVQTVLGGIFMVDVRGAVDGSLMDPVTREPQIESANGITRLMAGSISGNVHVVNGNLTMLMARGDVVASVEVDAGSLGQFLVIGGSFGTALDEVAVRSLTGIGSFSVRNGNAYGLVSTDGNLGSLLVTGTGANGVLSGRVRAGGNINLVMAREMQGALVAAGANLTSARVLGEMTDSWLFAGFDPGDAGYDPANGGEAANVQLDKVTADLGFTAVPDRAVGGAISFVSINGNMVRSTIMGGVSPSDDGFGGTSDDLVRGVGYVRRVTALGYIYGSANAAESYGVFAASAMPVVYAMGQPFTQNGNARVDSLYTIAGTLTVVDVLPRFNAVDVFFHHPVNFGTVNTAFKDPAKPTTFTLLASQNAVFGDGDDTNISDTVAHVLSYDSSNYMVTLRLVGSTWQTLGAGLNFQLTIDGSAVTDNRGNLLDGEYNAVLGFPSGDGVPGGDFVYEWTYGRKSLSAEVPDYSWWFGCSPTSGGIIAGYYDGLSFDGGVTHPYEDLIVGDASIETHEVHEAIATSGDGLYTGSGSIIPATPGTGNCGDYAMYDDVNDYGAAVPYLDLSSLDPAAAHPDDCLADFMGTGQSATGLTMGGTWIPDIGPGIEDYWAYKGYLATTTTMVYGIFTWGVLVAEINAGRPVLVNVDSSGDGTIDHSMVAVGYNAVTHEYQYHTTWGIGPGWAPFQSMVVGTPFGIHSAVLVLVS